MASKVIKGPFDGPGPKEPKEVTATFLDAELDSFTVRGAGPDGEIQIAGFNMTSRRMSITACWNATPAIRIF